MAKLEPCPFCGGTAELHTYSSSIKTDHNVYCRCCGASSAYMSNTNEAINMWNNRVTYIKQELKNANRKDG